MDENNIESSALNNSSIDDNKEEKQSDFNTETQTLSENTNDSLPEKGKQTSKEIYESDLDKTLHRDILEKLDIVKKDPINDIANDSEKEIYLKKVKDIEEFQLKAQVEKSMTQDIDKIQKLVKAGLISSAQGQNLKNQVLKNAFDKLVQSEKIKRKISTNTEKSDLQNKIIDKDKVFEDFSKSNPDFFNSEGRKEVLNYLKSDDILLNKDELNKISDIIRIVEKAAIDRYLQKASHEKNLKTSNENAKQRLTANAQKSNPSGKYSGTFTREQIGKMSGAEFAKYEKTIMEQLKKGVIR